MFSRICYIATNPKNGLWARAETEFQAIQTLLEVSKRKPRNIKVIRVLGCDKATVDTMGFVQPSTPEAVQHIFRRYEKIKGGGYRDVSKNDASFLKNIFNLAA